MPLSPGTKLGQYEVVEAIGAGGISTGGWTFRCGAGNNETGVQGGRSPLFVQW